MRQAEHCGRRQVQGMACLQLHAAYQMCQVYRLDPIHDSRWDVFIQRHPEASIFHARPWLESLNQTYGYQPVAFTTASESAALSNGIVCCRVKSWLTGSRFVSVPFADHCQPLVDRPEELKSLLQGLKASIEAESFRYFELRCFSSHVPRVEETSGLARSTSFVHHSLDLRPDLNALFRQFHHSCVQRKIRRAEREGLTYAEGTSDVMVGQFYSLFVMTRRRHALPPPPLDWFVNLRNAWKDALKVRVILKDAQPIASIITIRHKERLVYKYGCSDVRFHNLGAMPLLFWRSIQDGKRAGAHELDLGRSDLCDDGLITFKNRLGAKSSTLDYYCYPSRLGNAATIRRKTFFSPLYTYLPTSLLRLAGKLLYRHVA